MAQEIVLHCFSNRRPSGRLDDVGEVGCVDVHRFTFGPVANLLGRDQDELFAFFQQVAELVERLQTHFVVVAVGLTPCFNPSVAEAIAIPLQDFRIAPLDDRLHRHPSRSHAEHVVVGQRKEVVASLAVPVADHFRKLVTVTPQRVRVKISFPPSGRRFGDAGLVRRNGGKRRHKQRDEKSQTSHGRLQKMG